MLWRISTKSQIFLWFVGEQLEHTDTMDQQYKCNVARVIWEVFSTVVERDIFLIIKQLCVLLVHKKRTH